MSITIASAISACRGRMRRCLDTSRDRRAGGGFFTARWLGASAFVVVLGYAAALIFLVNWHKWYVNSDGNCRDFLLFWTSSKFTLSGAAAQVYDPDIFARAVTLAAPGKCLVQGAVSGGPITFPYPPTVLFFMYPWGLMPYSIAFTAWLTITMLLYLAAVYAIIPRLVAVIVALTVWPVYQNIMLGHVGFLTAGLFGLTLVLMERRPWLSGICLGLLTYKPQFGILFPVALLASRNWRVLLSATTTSVLFAAAATVAFGYETWPPFLNALFQHASMITDHIGAARWQLSTVNVLRAAGVNADLSWAAQLGVTATVAGIVWALWARPIPYSLKAAALSIAALLASPYSFQYDFCILTIAAAFLVQDGLSRGFLRGERGTMLACWFILHLIGPFPAIVCVVLLVLVIRRALLFRQLGSGTLRTFPQPRTAGHVQH